MHEKKDVTDKIGEEEAYDIDTLIASSSNKRNRVQRIINIIKKLTEEEDIIAISRLCEIVQVEEKIEKDYVEDVIDKLLRDGLVFMPRPGYVKYFDI